MVISQTWPAIKTILMATLKNMDPLSKILDIYTNEVANFLTKMVPRRTFEIQSRIF